MPGGSWRSLKGSLTDHHKPSWKRHAGAIYAKHDAIPYSLYEMTSSSLNLPASRWREERGETRVEPGPNRLDTMVYEANFGQIDIDWDVEKVTLSLMGAAGESLQSTTIAFSDIQLTD